jgi:hypothetical protein
MSETEELTTIQTIVMLVETVPILRADCAALQARCDAQAKALAVVLEKARLCADPTRGRTCGYRPFHPGARLVEVYVPLTPGELAIIEAAVKL